MRKEHPGLAEMALVLEWHEWELELLELVLEERKKRELKWKRLMVLEP